VTVVPYRRQVKTHQEESHMKTEAKAGVTLPHAKDPKSHPQLEKTRKNSSVESSQVSELC
jgi:hypothetical protein